MESKKSVPTSIGFEYAICFAIDCGYICISEFGKSKPENNFLRVTDKMSSTKLLVPDTEHCVPDIRNTKFLMF